MSVYPPSNQAERCFRKHVREVISHTNPIFLSSSGEADTEQETGGYEEHVKSFVLGVI